MSQKTLTETIEYAESKGNFEKINYIGNYVNPSGVYLEIQRGNYIAFIKRDEEENKKLPLKKIALVSIKKHISKNEFKHMTWYDKRDFFISWGKNKRTMKNKIHTEEDEKDKEFMDFYRDIVTFFR